MQADLAKIGVNAKLVTYEWGEYRKRMANGEEVTGQYGWTGDNGDPDNFFFLRGCPGGKPGGSNPTKWCNAEFDDLLGQGAHDLRSGRARQALPSHAGDRARRGAGAPARAFDRLRGDARQRDGLQAEPARPAHLRGRRRQVGSGRASRRGAGPAFVWTAHAALFRPPPRADHSDVLRVDVPHLRRDPSGAGRSGGGARRRARHFAGAARLLPPPVGARPAGLAAVPRLRLAHAARRFRRVAGDAAEGADRIPHAVSRDRRALGLRDAVRGSARRSRRRGRGGQARRVFRSGADDDLAVRLFHADLLVGPAADHVRLGRPRPDAGLRPHRPDQFLFRSADRLHDRRRPALRPERRLPRRAAPSRSARDRARNRAARRHRAHDALVDARSAVRGLRAHGAGEGTVAAARRRRARAAQRPVAGGHRHRPVGVEPAGRRGAHRDDLLLAGGRPLADRTRSAGATIPRCKAG